MSTSNDSPNESKPNFMKRLFSRNPAQEVGEEIQTLIEGREETEEPLSDHERELIASALRFNDIDAEEVAVPRGEVVYLNVGEPFDAIMDKFAESGFSRMPVCGENLDEVLGFLTLKDLVKNLSRKESFDTKKAMRPCTFVPDTLALSSVLAEMRANRVQMVVMIDEYGGTAGLITLKDILEELVGDIQDENEQDTPEMIVPLSAGRLRIDPRLPINEMDDALKKKFSVDVEADYDTVGGFVLSLAGRVPAKGEKIKLRKGHMLLVNEADGRRITRLTFIPKLKKKV